MPWVVMFLSSDEELSALKGIEGESTEDKPSQQVNMPIRALY